MLRGLALVVALIGSLALAVASSAADETKSAQALAAEAATLYQAASSVADPNERGRLFFLVRQRLERIKAAYPQSVIAAQLAFGRYQDIIVTTVEREAQSWAAAHPDLAAALAADPQAVAGGAAAPTAVPGLIPTFGTPAASTGTGAASAAAGNPIAATGGTAATGNAPAATAPAGQFQVAVLATPPAKLPQTELVRRLREAVVIIYNPVAQGSGTGFFISPRHLMTNTHVVVNSDRLVIANRTIGVRSVHVLYRGMNSQGAGIDTAILETDGWDHPAFLPFAEGVVEGEAITIGGYPGRASEGDKAYDQFFKLIMENSLPTADAIPNVKFDFGYVQSIFVDATTGIENLQNGVNTSGGNSGSPIVNHCGALVAQHYLGSRATLDVTTDGKAVGDTSKFNYAIAAKELTKFLQAANIAYTKAGGACPE